MIRYLCFECCAELRPADNLEDPEEQISHGLCRSCLQTAMSKFGRSLDELLNSFSEAVLVVDQNGRAITSNEACRRALGKDNTDIAGYLGGHIFGCFHAEKPEDCGDKLHCLSCVIRTTVEETYRTGITHTDIPACLDLDTYAGQRNANYSISTEKVDRAVLLKIVEIASG